MRHRECTSHSITEEKMKKIVLDIINKQIDLMVDVDKQIEIISKKDAQIDQLLKIISK